MGAAEPFLIPFHAGSPVPSDDPFVVLFATNIDCKARPYVVYGLLFKALSIYDTYP